MTYLLPFLLPYLLHNLPATINHTRVFSDVSDDASEESKLDNRENVQEARVVMTFNNIDEIVAYYREYGKQLGFPVRKRISQKKMWEN
ncbi:unnamed protein product [Prunus armeniaca]|uniref:FAR1 domain-containing protein n=1 Tax=Prunus armeniaca TaxID=36596 RepID=A0A6J5UQF2_PRUAR|nr:unnamed protein product [Prunus armeniaca]CAB4309271.1 unnamed protein product [Prunus armeniaca]